MAPKGVKVVATNRRARYDYEVLETLEAGIALVGTEVKSLRAGQVQLKDSYAKVDDGELWLYNAHVAPYGNADGFGGHDVERRRKLLVHRREIDRMAKFTQEQGRTLVPMKLYWKDGRAKLLVGLGVGKARHDKRQDLARKDAQRQIDRALRARQKT